MTALTSLTANQQESIIQCPVCGSICTDTPIYKYSAVEAAAHFCPVTRNSQRNQRLLQSIRQLWKGDECSIIQCHECDFAFAYPYVAGDEQFYSILHEQYGYPRWRWDYDIAVKAVIDHSQKGRILDIGAGTGNFLKSLDSEWETYAVEGSDTTRNELEKAGIKVFPSLSDVVIKEAETFQVITMFQVLEHIGEFQQVLAQCYQILKPQGKLLITVPDGKAMLQQEKITGCPDMPPNHLNKWTAKNLSLALEKSGFQVESVIKEPSSWHHVAYSLQLKIMHDAASNPNSIAARIYRIPNRKLRIPLLSLLAPISLFQLAGSINQLLQGESFGILAIKPSPN